MTLSELTSEWIETYQRDHIKHQSYVKYKCAIKNYIDPTIGSREITEFSRRNVQEYINKLKRSSGIRTKSTLAPATVNTALTVLKLVFGYAVDFDMLPTNPTDRVRGAKREFERVVKCFSLEEQRRIEEYAYRQNSPFWFGIILDLYTGLRIGELLALEWDDVDFLNGCISVNKTLFISQADDGNWVEMTNTPKTRTSFRDIPLPEHILKQLVKFKASSTSKRVVSRDDGKLLDTRTYRWRYNQMLHELGIRQIPFHSLRHTFATRAVENGMDVKTLAEILGHANPTITLNVYTHSMIDHKKIAMQAMKPLVNGGNDSEEG